MPFYTWLRPSSRDGRARLALKQRATHKLQALREALAAHIAAQPLPDGEPAPGSSSQILRLATWNLREFDSPSYGERGEEALAYIAEIMAHFDLIALQEIRRDLGPLKRLLRLLGPNWDFIATDVTEGGPGNKERMAFVYDRSKVWFTDVAGELTLPDGQKVTDPFGERFRVAGGARITLPAGASLRSPTGLRTATLRSGATKLKESVEMVLPDATQLTLPAGTLLRFAKNARVPVTDAGGIVLGSGSTRRLPEAAEIVLPPDSLVGGREQFARTPYVVSFQSGWLKLNLATVHILYGDGAAGLQQRTEEIRRLTALLAGRASSDSDSDADAYFIALGDFNIVDREHGTMDALRSNGFEVPAPLQSLPGSNVKKDKFYDQIALWTGASRRRKHYTRIRAYRAGVFDFFDVVYRLDEEAVYRPFMTKPDGSGEYSSYSGWRTYQMSDHLPMWVELHVDFSDEYLQQVSDDLDERLG
jgi:endonuclease/exonuclease/phosphatase family metal-dependent hydrolase